MVCDRGFLEQEPHVSLLSIEELESGRSDICRECFAEREAELVEGTGRVWWRTRHTVAEKKGVQLDLESLQALFEALEEKEDLGWQELRYLLCLILMRKRRIKVLAVKRLEGQEIFIVRKPRTEVDQVVRIFDFTPERQEELRATLTAIFEGADLAELDPNAPVVTEADEALAELEETAEEPADGAPEAAQSGDSSSSSDDVHENGNAEADAVKA